jgi:hypothetical protein
VKITQAATVYQYTITDPLTGRVMATATGTGAEKGLWAQRWTRSGHQVTRTEAGPAAAPLAGLVAAFDAEAARMRATMGDQGSLFGAEAVVGLGQLPGQRSLFAGGA